jgi:hypothetical protein
MSDQNTNAVAPEFMARGLNRRSLLARAGLVGAAAVVGGGLLGETTPSADAALGLTFGPKGDRFGVTDIDILNFALNLEYLEAEFYQRAAYGTPLAASMTSPGAAKGTGTTGTVTGPTTATVFTTTAVQQYAQEIATDELNHVEFLRTALGKYAVAEPTIDLVDSFTNAAIAAGVITTGQTFDPFTANPGLGLTADASFLLGAFIFEDVGVTAYHGAAPYIKNSTYLSKAAGILAVEAYHASEVRLQLLQLGAATPGIITVANAISALRNAASAGADGVTPTDQGITLSGVPNIVPTDANSIAFARSFGAVLNIVYLNTTPTPSKGGFFPDGLNGPITTLVPPVKKGKTA